MSRVALLFIFLQVFVMLVETLLNGRQMNSHIYFYIQSIVRSIYLYIQFIVFVSLHCTLIKNESEQYIIMEIFLTLKTF